MSFATSGLSADRLNRIAPYLEDKYVKPGRLPGTATAVWRRGEPAHFATTGFADVERRTPLSQDTIYRIYSMTKPVTSVAFMMLVEEGKVALEDPVHRFIPSWRDLGVFNGGTLDAFQTKRTDQPMRMIDLLRHTSGLTYGFQNRSNVDAAYRKLKIGEIEKAGTLEDMIEKVSKLPLEFSPASAWNYSISTDVLGYLVGVISGLPFDEFLRTRIFQPLGMSDTGFFVPPEKASRLAACYAMAPPGATALPGASAASVLGTGLTGLGGMVLQDDPQKSPYLHPPSFVSGGGGLVSTVDDYLRFCRMLISGGALDGVRLLSPKTVELMTQNHLPGGAQLIDMSRSLFSEQTYAGLGFGLGFAVNLNPAATMVPGSHGDFYWGGAASTFFWIDPREALIGIFMTQLLPSSAYPVRREFRTLVYSALEDSATWP